MTVFQCDICGWDVVWEISSIQGRTKGRLARKRKWEIATHRARVIRTHGRKNMGNALQDALIDLAKVKEQIEDLSQEKADIEEVIVAALKATGMKSVSANNGDLRGTLVEASVITIDEEGLRKRLTAAQWKKVTKQVLDKEKLEAEITVGNVDANEVAAVSKEVDRKPYIRVTGTFRPKKKAAARPSASVATKNSNGGTKPAAKKRVVRPKKTI